MCFPRLGRIAKASNFKLLHTQYLLVMACMTRRDNRRLSGESAQEATIAPIRGNIHSDLQLQNDDNPSSQPVYHRLLDYLMIIQIIQTWISS